MTHKISIVITAFNYGKYVGKAIESVLSQDYPDFELLVLNNASEDNTHEVISRYVADPRLHYVINETNIGAAANTVKGFELATGEFLIFLSADDYFLPGALSRLAAELIQHPELGFVYARYVFINDEGRLLDMVSHPGWEPFDHREHPDELGRLLAYDCYVATVTTLFRRSVFEQSGFFDLSFRVGDYELFLRFASHGAPSKFLNIALAAFRVHGKQLSVGDEFVGSGLQINDQVRLLERYLTEEHAAQLSGYEAQILNLLDGKLRLFEYSGGSISADLDARIRQVKQKLLSLSAYRPIVGLGDKPLVSVVVPTLGRPVLLMDALDSLLNQTYAHWEAIIVNDGGVSMAPLIEGKDQRIRYLEHRKSLGQSAARNTGLRFAKGEVICYLDDDDIFLPDHLSTVVDALRKNNTAGLVYTDVAVVIEEVGYDLRKELSREKPYEKIQYSRELLHVQNFIPINAWAHRRECLKAVGPFDEKLQALEDWEFLIRLSRKYDFVHIPRTTVEAHTRLKEKDNVSARHRRDFVAIYQEIYRRHDDLGNPGVRKGRDDFLVQLAEGLVNEEPLDLREPAQINPLTTYQSWLELRQLSKMEAKLFEERIAQWGAHPRIHLAAVATGPNDSLLAGTIQSLAQQYYYNLIVTVVAPYAAPQGFQGERLKWAQTDHSFNSLIAAVNQSLFDAPADWAGLITVGDLVAPHAFLTIMEAAFSNKGWRLIYSDEDAIDASGVFAQPYFKPDFNLDLLRSFPYLGGGVFFRKDAFTELGGFATDKPGAESYDLVLRGIERFGAGSVGHAPDVLYHRNPGASYTDQLPAAEVAETMRRALEDHFGRLDIAARVEPGTLQGSHRITYLHPSQPFVSLMIPVRGRLSVLQRCLESVLENTQYPNYEILIVDDNSRTGEVRDYLEGVRAMNSDQLRVVSYPKPFNAAAMNNFAAREARGEYLLLLEDDTAALHADWLDVMMSHAQRPEVGIVGARLLSHDGMIQHAGMVLGMSGAADTPFIGYSADDAGYYGRLQLEQNFSAVTAACLLIRKTVYEELGTLEENAFNEPFYGVDLCLKAREKDYLVVWTPYASLLHEHAANRDKDTAAAETKEKQKSEKADEKAMWRKWLPQLARDPAYNINLTLRSRNFEIETDTVLSWNPLSWRPLPRVLAQAGDREGCGEYRVIAPLCALSAAGRIQGIDSIVVYTPVEMERIAPDSIILQRQIEPHQIEAIRRHKAFSRALRVFEIDDLITNLPAKSIHRQYFPQDTIKRLRTAVSLCDRLVVATEPLAHAYREFNDDLRVIPNFLEGAKWDGLQPQRRHGAKPRVGWAGSISHTGDLELIADVVKALAGEVEWVFFGMCPDSLRAYVQEFHAPVSIEQYPAALASLNLDLALAPLEIHPFNEAKSHLKLLEYGILGYPVICTDITPYQGDYPVTRVRNRHQEWVKAIREQIHDLDACAAAGSRLQDYVRRRWLLEDHLDAWLKGWLP